jgi:predicted metalloprotease with PDZ domain
VSVRELAPIIVVSLLAALMCGPAALGSRTEERRRLVRLTDTPVEYTVLLREPQTQMVDVVMSVRGVRGPELVVCLPVWRPGKYQVLDLSGGVREVRASSGAGRALGVSKRDKSTWVVAREPGDDDEVVVSYRVYANSLGDRTRHVDDTHAFLSPSAVFMYAPEFRGRGLKVRVEAPEGWEVATSLERDPDDPATLLAPGYDVLVDSPLEIGRHERLSFDVDGTPHEIVIWNPTGQGRTLDEARITGDFAKIVRAERDVFGELPYGRYVFLIHAYPGGSGGTEHLNSTIMGCSPAALRDEDAFKRFLGLVSHEFFHTWNVKRLRPAGLQPYDYQRENYTDLLWVAEGTTSYFDDLCLVRAGLMRPDEYLRTLGRMMESHESRPGSRVQSLAESSTDAWVKFNKPTPDAANSTVSFYDKGALVSFLLDMEVRRASGNRSSLDTLMREMYRAFPLSGPGYSAADLREMAERLAGADLGGFFDRYVEGTERPDFGAALAVVGLEVTPREVKGKEAEPGEAYIGMTVEARDGLAAVATVLSDGPAYAAGVVPGDLVLAVNGQRLRPGELDAITRKLAPGDQVRLTLSRYDTLREVTFAAGQRPGAKFPLRRSKQAGAEAVAAYESWLGQKWPDSGDGVEREDAATPPKASERGDETYTPPRRPAARKKRAAP